MKVGHDQAGLDAFLFLQNGRRGVITIATKKHHAPGVVFYNAMDRVECGLGLFSG